MNGDFPKKDSLNQATWLGQYSVLALTSYFLPAKYDFQALTN